MADDILDEADEFIQDGGYAGPLVRNMKAEIERLRLELFMKPVPNILVRADSASLRLTDAEREAIEQAVQILRDHDAGDSGLYDTLRGLLDRCALVSE